jgi:multidrug resistance efflux pump
VDDNNRVQKGDLLVQLDKEPNQVQVNIAKAAVSSAQADLVAAQAQVRGLEASARSQRFNLARAIEEQNNQVAELRSRIATLTSKKATLARAKAHYEQDGGWSSGAVSRQGSTPLRSPVGSAGRAREGRARRLPDSRHSGCLPNQKRRGPW